MRSPQWQILRTFLFTSLVPCLFEKPLKLTCSSCGVTTSTRVITSNSSWLLM